MNQDYENVEWNVHATADALTPAMNIDDPLSAYSAAYNPNYEQEVRDKRYTAKEIPKEQYKTVKATHISTIPTSPSIESAESLSSLSRDTGATVVAEPEPAVASPMVIRLVETEKHMDSPQGAYVAYLVSCMTSLRTFSSHQSRPVWRRFQDFVWLHNALTLEFPACIIPPLPDRRDRFSKEFIERRKWSLQWFLDRIAKHPQLQLSQSVRIFLESNDFQNDKRMQSRRVSPAASVLESIGGSLFNAFTKVKKPDERFVEMKENFDKIHDNLDTVERLYSRISKRQQDLQQDYAGFAESMQGFSVMESEIAVPLQKFSETTREYSLLMKAMTTQEDVLFLNEIHELLAYCHSAKAALRARDQKQVEFEALSGYLQQAVQDRERTLYPTRYSSGSSLNITDFFTEKLNEVRGIDVQRARRDKLDRLDHRIKELEGEVARTNDISNNFSSQVLKESEIFEKAKNKELKQGLTAYADSHIDFFKNGVLTWEKILPVLESIDVGDLDQRQ
ncbi:hypothetical protein CLU79DRAFT_836052 [Phycomyces nitens]|nr:hypothetical protein CLU79DRAFT_836052 [Phycomyces nitens]